MAPTTSLKVLFLFQGGCNKVPQTWWFYTAELYSCESEPSQEQESQLTDYPKCVSNRRYYCLRPRFCGCLSCSIIGARDNWYRVLDFGFCSYPRSIQRQLCNTWSIKFYRAANQFTSYSIFPSSFKGCKHAGKLPWHLSLSRPARTTWVMKISKEWVLAFLTDLVVAQHGFTYV